MILNLQYKNKHKMKQASQIFTQKGMINGELHLLPLKNKI